MTPGSRKGLLLAIGAIVLVALSAGASAFVTRNQMDEEKSAVKPTVHASNQVKTRKEQINWNEPRPQPQPQVQRCDDGNIVGAALGGVAGGLVGNQFGKGKGKDLATIGGVIAGGTAGHQYIPTRGTLCR